MYDDKNIFARILRGELTCKKIYENEVSLFFEDINPQAKIHVLGIPKISCVDFSDFVNKADHETLNSFFQTINTVLDKLDIKKDGYRIISNSGIDGGQEVPHFHVHILAGEKIGQLK